MRQIGLMTGAHLLEVLAQAIAHEIRQHHATVLLPLAATNRDLATLEIEVLHTQLQTLLQTQSGAVEQRGDKPWHTLQLPQDSPHFVGTQNDRDVYGSLRTRRGSDDTKVLSQHLVVQEQDGAERLILCRRCDVPLHSKGRKERSYVWRAQLPRVPLAIEDDVSPDPVNVRLLGTPTVVTRTNGLANTVEQFRRATIGTRVIRSSAARALTTLATTMASSVAKGQRCSRWRSNAIDVVP